MTAAASVWLNAHLDRMTGEDALVWVGVIAGVSTFVGASLVAAWSLWWPAVCRKLARWHAAQVRAANTPTRYEDRDESAGNVALVVTLAFCALIAAILWGAR